MLEVDLFIWGFTSLSTLYRSYHFSPSGLVAGLKILMNLSLPENAVLVLSNMPYQDTNPKLFNHMNVDQRTKCIEPETNIPKLNILH